MHHHNGRVEKKGIGETLQDDPALVLSLGFEKAVIFFASQLWEEEGKEALTYLGRKRRYTLKEIEGMELGFFPAPEKAQLQLGDLITRLGLSDEHFGTTHRLVIPYRDPMGQMKGFIVRRLNAIRPKFIYSAGTIRDTLFNSCVLRGEQDAVVVEGYFDALIATQRGIKGVVAIGGTRLTQMMVDEMIEKGVTTVTLVPDNDLRGHKGADQSLHLMADSGLDASVLPLPESVKDLDEFLRKKGVDAFYEHRKTPLTGEQWRARYRRKSEENIKVQIRTAGNGASPSRVYYITRDQQS